MENYKEIPFPEEGNIVYVILYRTPTNPDSTPLYVGESTRNIGRFGDYIKANFRAQTDFKVGRVVRLLRNAGCEVIVRYATSQHRKVDERALIAKYRAKGIHLLNDLPGYNYKSGNEGDEERRLLDFVKLLIN